MPKRILSIAYDEALLKTRHLLLERAGYDVRSALGFVEARELCNQGGSDLIILGHSIPRSDKSAIVDLVKQRCGGAPVLALRRADEAPIEAADLSIDHADPDSLLKAVGRMLGPAE